MADRNKPCCFRACSRIFRRLQYFHVVGSSDRKRPSEEQGRVRATLDRNARASCARRFAHPCDRCGQSLLALVRQVFAQPVIPSCARPRQRKPVPDSASERPCAASCPRGRRPDPGSFPPAVDRVAGPAASSTGPECRSDLPQPPRIAPTDHGPQSAPRTPPGTRRPVCSEYRRMKAR